MLSAKEAYDCYWENSAGAYKKQLEIIEKQIKDACVNMRTFVPLEGRIFPETKDELLKLGYQVEFDYVSWGKKK